MDLINEMRIVLRQRIENLQWMSGDTKAQALQKLDAIHVKVGYPEVWDDHSSNFVVLPDQPFAINVLNARLALFQKKIATANIPTDKNAWHL